MCFERVIATGIVASCTFIATPAIATEDDFNIWTGQFIVVDLDQADAWFVRGEAQERFTNDADRLGQLLLRSMIGYRINDRLNIGAGYAFIYTDPVGPTESNEHRIYQELNVRLVETAAGLTVDSRNRLEQRFFEEDGETGWRYRNLIQMRAPISETNKFVAYTAPFIGLNETRFNRGGLAVWRNFAGVSFPLAESIEVVPGYLNQYVFRDGEDRVDHIANVNAFMNF